MNNNKKLGLTFKVGDLLKLQKRITFHSLETFIDIDSTLPIRLQPHVEIGELLLSLWIKPPIVRASGVSTWREIGFLQKDGNIIVALLHDSAFAVCFKKCKIQ